MQEGAARRIVRYPMMRIVGYSKVRAVGKIRKNRRSRAYSQSDRIMGTLTMRVLGILPDCLTSAADWPLRSCSPQELQYTRVHVSEEMGQRQ